ncbi:MAG: MarR family winged helix-turn-helix transcriptional regulator [Bacillota bacterium]
MDLNVFEKASKLFCQALIYRVLKPSLEGPAKEQLTEVQLSCIQFVAAHPDPSIGEIAAGLAISNAASAKLVDRLVKKKLLTREEDPKDRRVLQVKLTPKGKEFLKDIKKIEAAQFNRILQKMTAEEIAALESGMAAFLKAALENPEQVEQICLHCGWEHIINCPGNLRYRELTGKDKDSV